MKKFLSLALALMMVLALSVTCFAATSTITANGGTATGDISATYQAGATDGEIVYSVDVEFGDMTFVYTAAGTTKWDPATHSYPASAAAGWDKTTATITVTNHSNTALTATLAVNKGEYTGPVTAQLDKTTLNIASAVGTAVDQAPAASATLTIGGVPANAADNFTGSVTVTIAPQA